MIYTRVSRDAAAGRSVQDQERECRSVCERNGWEVRRVFCDNDIGASRHSLKDRPAWKECKSALRQGDILVVWEASRAQRDLEEFVELRNRCATLAVPLSYAGRVLDLTLGDDRFVAGLDALVAERESEQIRVRILRGKRASAADGKPSTRPPWGYCRVDVAKWEPDPLEAPRVKEAVERTLAGETRYGVLSWLRETGYAPASISALKRALVNPALAGLRVHRGAIVGKGSWAPIITEAQHRKLGGITRLPALPGPEPIHLLTNIAKCAVCSEGLRHRRDKDRKARYRCYRGHVSRPADALDEFVMNELFDRLKDVDPNQYEADDETADQAIKEIEAIEGQLGEWIEAAKAGDVTPGAFSKIEKGLLERIAALRPKTESTKLRKLTAEQLRKAWPSLTIRERRAAIRGFMIVTVHPGGRGARGGVDIVRI